MNKREIIVEKNKNLVAVLQDYGFSYADVNKMLRNKDVRINGKVQRENIFVSVGDVVTFYFADSMLDKKYDIVFETEKVLIVYKKAGVETAGENGLEKILPNAIAVHRLDRNTEGLVVFAKTKQVEESLLAGFKNKQVHKFYIAEVVGDFDCSGQIFTAYLVKDSEKALVKIFDKKVQGSVKIETKIETVKHASQSSLVCVELLTGKTHQIRAHLAFLGHPIIGDGKYGKQEDNKRFGQKRQKLACFKLKFEKIGVEELDDKEFQVKPKWWAN